MNIWDNELLLAKLEQQREKKRQREGCLTFDCLHLKVYGDRAYCELGKHLGQADDGSLALITVLRGVTSSVCRNCKEFITEEALDESWQR